MHQQLIIFARQGSESSKNLQTTVNKAARAQDVDWCISIENFIKKFRTPNHYSTILLLIENHADLDQFLNCSDFFDELRVFLILPDREEHTISKGNRLFPRFVTYSDSNFNELSEVIRNTLRKGQHDNAQH